MNKNMFELCREKGIIVEPCPPYIHEMEEIAKRYNRTIMNLARCLLSDSKLNIKYWPEIIKTAAYLNNRTIINTCENKTPFEIFVRKKPNISNLKLYGSKVFVRVPEIKRQSKWDRKADIGILVGYESVGYRVLVNNKIIVTRHVDFVENEKLIEFKGEDKSVDESDLSINKNSECNEIEENVVNEDKKERRSRNTANENVNDQEINLRWPQRERKKPDRYGISDLYYIYINIVSVDSPKTYEEALQGNDCDL